MADVADLQSRLARVQLLLLDVDGVLTDGGDDKFAAAAEVIAGCGLSWEQTAFLGDDLPDLPVVSRCGVGAAVADACAELRRAAAVVTTLPGGRGAVRELIERMLAARGAWEAEVARHASQRI